MNCNSTIPVYNILGATLHTRQAATELLLEVTQNPCDHIELDFADVNYISRSFADQFHAEKLVIASQNQKNIIVTNANEEIIKMLQAVSRTQNKDSREYEEIPVYNYTNWKSLEMFLLSL